MLALIDGDVVVYRTGWASEKETQEAIPCIRANKTIEDILADTGATEYQVWFSDRLENNYRIKIDPGYKSSRQKQPKPKWYQSLKSFLTKEWNAQVTEGQEADDILGIMQTAAPSGFGLSPIKQEGCPFLEFPSIICTIDKDLLQVPGKHYNFVRKEFNDISYTVGLLNFYSQFLIGDKVDDIEGIYGLGPVKTKQILGSCNTELEMFEKVRYQYKDDERLLRNGRLLWVRRQPNQMWEFPIEASIQNESGECRDSPDGYSVGEETLSGGVLQQ